MIAMTVRNVREKGVRPLLCKAAREWVPGKTGRTSTFRSDHNADPTLYLRSDLQWQHRRVFGRDRWVVRDPLTLRFFYLSEHEYQITRLLRRPHRLKFIIAQASDLGVMSDLAVRKLLLALSRAGLLRAVESNRSSARSQQPKRRSSSIIFTGLSLPLRLLALKIPLGDPSLWLQRTAWIGRAFFNRAMLVALTGLWLSLGLLAALRWDRIEIVFPDLQQSFGWQAVALFVAAYVLLKSCHEISHAMACQRFGAECHEVGILLLCFTPCFYCDVTDSWRIQHRLPRAGIGAAGVYAESWVAVVAGFFWMFSTPGLLHAMCFSLFLVGSLGTIFINSNPLLRYDGYYVLSDLCNIPNLAQQTGQACWGTLRQLISKSASPPPTLDAPRSVLVLYGLLSWTYRIAILAVILWSLDYFFASLRMAEIGRSLVLVLLTAAALQAGLVGGIKMRQLWQHPAVSRLRLMGMLTLLVTGCWFLAVTPFHYDLGAKGLFSLGTRVPVYAIRSGLLIDSVNHCEIVKEGDQLFRLQSSSEALRMVELESSVQQLQKKIDGLQTLGGGSIEVAASRETLARLLDSMRSQLETARQEWESLVGLSPGSGQFIAADVRRGQQINWEAGGDPGSVQTVAAAATRSDSLHSETLGRWPGRSTDPAFGGRYIRRGELFGWIIEDEDWYVDAFLYERQVERVIVGAGVRVRMSDRPEIERAGVVDSISREPTEMQAGKSTDGAAWGGGKVYLLRIRLDEPRSSKAQAGIVQTDQMLAELRIETRAESLATRMRRYFAETVRW